MDLSANKSTSDLFTVEPLSVNGINFKTWQKKLICAINSFDVGYVVYECTSKIDTWHQMEWRKLEVQNFYNEFSD